MTKRRAPSSLDAALTRIADVLPGGYSEMADITRRREGLVRAWGDPDRREEIPVRDALDLDKACDALGGGTPIAEFYLNKLKASGALCPAPGDSLADHGVTLVRECGEAIAAFFEASQSNPSDPKRAEACTEVREAISMLERALPMLIGSEAFGHAHSGEPQQRAPP